MSISGVGKVYTSWCRGMKGIKMLPKILNVIPLKDYRLFVYFDDETGVIYDVKEDMNLIESYGRFLPLLKDCQNKWKASGKNGQNQLQMEKGTVRYR